MLSVLHSDSAINQEDSLLTILRYQIPTQDSVQLCVVNSHGYMSNFTASKDAEVWIVKEEMNRFYIFIVEIYIYFLPFQTAEHNFFFLKQEMQLVFVSTMASVLRFFFVEEMCCPAV